MNTIVIGDGSFLTNYWKEVYHESSCFWYAQKHNREKKPEEVHIVVNSDAGVEEAAVMVEAFDAVIAHSIINN
jgi:hypothetical protein